jgi:hypothetical protein
MAWIACGVLLAFYYPLSDAEALAGVLMIHQGLTGALALRRFRQTSTAVLPDFLTVFLFMLFVNKTVTLVGLIASSGLEGAGELNPTREAYEIIPLRYQFKAEALFLVATVLFLATWRLLEGRRPTAVWTEPASRGVWWLYAVGLLAYVAMSVTGTARMAGMSSTLAQMASIGGLAVLVGGHSKYALGHGQAWLPVLALTPWYWFALRSGMKGEFLIASLPVLLAVFRRPTRKRLGWIGVFLAVVLLFVFPFSNTWRRANWRTGTPQTRAGVIEVASDVYGQLRGEGMVGTVVTSTRKWLSRGSTSTQGGLVMWLEERDGRIGATLLSGIGGIFIPRLFWPEKPTYTPGAWFTWYLGNAPSPELATSATATMLATELYWSFGIAAVLSGIPGICALYFFAWRGLQRRSSNRLVPMAGLFALLAGAGDLQGMHVIYAVSTPSILYAAIVLLDRLQRDFLPHLGMPRRP